MRQLFSRHWFFLLVVAYVLYALAFIARSSVGVHGEWYFLLLDDAMISMTYARNLAHGDGAVWYPGVDPVEGYTNPLWMLYMAAIHLLPLPDSMMSLPIQLTGIPLIVGALYFVKRITEQLVQENRERRLALKGVAAEVAQPDILAPFLAVLLTAFYLPLNNWTLRGMEVGLLAFGASLAAWGALQSAARGKAGWWLFPWLGLMTAVRLDALVVGVVIVSWLAWALPKRRLRTFLFGVGWLALFVIAQTLIRKNYYHDWLPNTYYLKVDGSSLAKRLLWGCYVLLHFLVGIGVWLVPLVAVYAFLRRSKTVSLLVALILAQTCYSVYVGGDAWEWWGGANRYLCVVIPIFFALVAMALVALSDLLADAAGVASRARSRQVALVFGLLTFVQVNCYQFTVASSLGQWLLAVSPAELSSHETKLRAALTIREATKPEARVAVIWAGIIPYFSQRPAIDLLGKNDRKIAKGPVATYAAGPLSFLANAPIPYCWPGHTKFNFRYSIGELKPDVIAEQWSGMEEVIDVLRSDYVSALVDKTTLLLKKDSQELKLNLAQPQ